ncbi:MAG: hypothetical protein U0T84_11265 [Chitinophagales bacterium]
MESPLQLLQQFSKPELSRFRQFIINGPGSNEHLLELLDALIPVLRGGSSWEQKLMLGQKMMQSARKGRSDWQQWLPQLQQLAESFLSTQYEKQKGTVLRAVGPVLEVTGIDQLIRLNYQLVRKAGGTISRKQKENYLLDFMQKAEAAFHQQVALRKLSASKRMAALESFYWLNKLRLACEKKTHRQQFEFPDHVDETAQLYAHIYLMLQFEDQDTHEATVQYKKVKQLLKSDEAQMPEFVVRDAYVFIINFCVRRLNKGQLEYIREIGELYVQAMRLNFLFEDWEMAPLRAAGNAK